ncbi:DNA helicase II / ATP-dependent DNA helicase PcrA [Proteiniborus sp. DW1]|uniref:RNA polymerase recycling motor HelD n=1 Tax=Proteiniborus sp. DW1 TaxID=1889883 RepID=UPI00092E0A9F|nr:RNA polymerase recycling motor HelD [Proteiniborus sp. DW1]SCG82596.1 DNA helicase II / ATP-dependent DNA helicase PcrA [Proteiniborus sp. DW1]
MQAQKHPAYDEENRFLKDICKCMNAEIDYLEKETKRMDDELSRLKRSVGGSYSDDVIVKTTVHEANKKKLNQLKKAEEKPYFGRIDFKDIDKSEYETFYIGKTSLSRRDDDKMLILDWRAPMASLYYSGEIGEVMYKAPSGLIIGDLEIKRQYEIYNKELINIFDKGLTPMDEYLQSALWEKKDNRLRDIVNTIQSEQNDIIRADKGKVLIVQGVAGSGKTTIVLHRIAYLMYTYQEVFDTDKLLIIVPNNLFLNYISDVLPDLGVEEIKQSTFEDLAMTLLNKEYRLVEAEKKFFQLLDYKNLSQESRSLLKFSSYFKGSMIFKNIIDKYVVKLSSSFVPKTDLKIKDFVVYSYEEVIKMYEEDYRYLPIVPRSRRIRKYIEANIADRVKEIQSKITKRYDNKVKLLKASAEDIESIREELIKVYDERDRLNEELENSMHKSIREYFNQWQSIDVDMLYKTLLTDFNNLRKYIDKEIDQEKIEFISSYSKSIFNNGMVEREDLAALLYFHLKLEGLSLKGKYNHIVVDEAQDYSELQMYILRQLSSNDSFTIVGDISQGIHSYKGIGSWKELMEDVFSDCDRELLNLKICYRSTMEIMNFANEVIKKLRKENIILAEPVLRSGDKPFIIKKNSETEITSDIALRIKELKNEGHKSIAIICKTTEESLDVYEMLKNSVSDDINLITDKDISYSGGIVVISAYLSKGLEFDVVIVFNCSDDNYILDELHVKLFYVSITRPLHKLFIYHKGKPSELLDIDGEYFNNL